MVHRNQVWVSSPTCICPPLLLPSLLDYCQSILLFIVVWAGLSTGIMLSVEVLYQLVCHPPKLGRAFAEWWKCGVAVSPLTRVCIPCAVGGQRILSAEPPCVCRPDSSSHGFSHLCYGPDFCPLRVKHHGKVGTQRLERINSKIALLRRGDVAIKTRRAYSKSRRR